MAKKNSRFEPLIIDSSMEVVTPYILTYGTLTVSGGNCKTHITDLGGVHVGSFRLPEWAFYGPISARYSGNPKDFIIVDLFHYRLNGNRDALLHLWESQFKIAMLEGQKLLNGQIIAIMK